MIQKLKAGNMTSPAASSWRLQQCISSWLMSPYILATDMSHLPHATPILSFTIKCLYDLHIIVLYFEEAG